MEGELLSAPMLWEAGKLSFIFRTESDGYIDVSVEDDRGYPLTGYDLDLRPRVQGPIDSVNIPYTFGLDVGAGPKKIMKFPTRGPVRLRLKLRRESLYGWSWRM